LPDEACYVPASIAHHQDAPAGMGQPSMPIDQPTVGAAAAA